MGFKLCSRYTNESIVQKFRPFVKDNIFEIRDGKKPIKPNSNEIIGVFN